MKERLQEYALIGEIIGAIAIVISLLFVGVQVRQSNSIATTDAIRDGTKAWVDVYKEAYGTEEALAFFRKAIHQCEELSDAERGRFHALLGSFISAYDNVYNQYINGRLPEEIYISIGVTYYGVANTPCAQQTLQSDYILMPPWLLSADGIAVLDNHKADMRLPSFVN